MIERYTREEMKEIWTEENKYKAWLEVEILAAEAWAELGEIPKEDVKKFAKMRKSIFSESMKLKRILSMM
ncbi:glutamyl-tRNA synthetase [Tepidibacillus decaturensis]|uniref:Glutamyl-tRNA synthetase n=1 Tax=Tepidibacillus decaturensis TaxID=1413211 RepID=A0A135L0T5_9BACI|nr:glutamyl-tRNA synthetase [Tepidibacillus decaturensis]